MAAADYTHSPGAEDMMAFLDGEGTVEWRMAIEAHLADCAACQVIASEQRQLSVEAKAWTVGPPPASLRAPARPRRLLRMPLPTWVPSGRTAAGFAAAAAVAIVVAVGAAEHFRTGNDAQGSRSDPESSQSNARAASPRERAELVDRTAQAEGNTQLQSQLEYSRRMLGNVPMAGDLAAQQQLPRKPSVIRTAKLRIVTKDFANVQPTVEQVVTAAGGFVDHLTATSEAGLVRSVRGVVRIPADRLDTVTGRLRQLGQVLEDTQGSEDVTDQLVDLDARLRSARATERRLTDLLANRTAKLSDVLEVERELARVRVEIERLDAETTNLGRRVNYAALTLEIMEERKAGLTPGSLSFASRLRVAAANGLETALESVVSVLLTVMEIGPLLLLWAVPIGSAWLIFRRVWRARTAHSGS